ncbi:MAG: hypothetical protein Q9220_007223 [cf. Caloplaca sp. 1 TL-2023]
MRHLSQHPPDSYTKRWGRHLPTGPGTEKLPRLYYIVDDTQAPTTCGIIIDVDEQHAAVEDTFKLTSVVHAAKVVYEACLKGQGKVGWEYVGAKGVEVKMIRIDVPRSVLRMGISNGTQDDDKKREVLPDGRSVLVISDLGLSRQRNVSQIG